MTTLPGRGCRSSTLQHRLLTNLSSLHHLTNVLQLSRERCIAAIRRQHVSAVDNWHQNCREPSCQATTPPGCRPQVSGGPTRGEVHAAFFFGGRLALQCGRWLSVALRRPPRRCLLASSFTLPTRACPGVGDQQGRIPSGRRTVWTQGCGLGKGGAPTVGGILRCFHPGQSKKKNGVQLHPLVLDGKGSGARITLQE